MRTIFLHPVTSVLCGLVLLGTVQSSIGQSGEAGEDPDFHEVRRLVSENLKGVTEQELNRAAVMGFIRELYPKVSLVTNALDHAEALEESLVAKSAIFDGAFGYVRISKVRSGLAKQVSSAVQVLESQNKLTGLILDLRFSNGQDYAAAAAVADLFLDADRLLLKWGDSVARSTPKSDSIQKPVAVLVNHRTGGAAEALAAALRETEVSLTIGSQTAGAARLYEEFLLTNGQRIRVASESLQIGEGRRFPEMGLTPDLLVAVDEKTERAFLEDPFMEIASTLTTADGKSEVAAPSGLQRRRMNESDLIRMRGLGNDLDSNESAPLTDVTQKPLIRDPALARAVDFLKGLALFRKQR